MLMMRLNRIFDLILRKNCEIFIIFFNFILPVAIQFYILINHLLHKYGQVEFIDGTQRSEEPVSKFITNF